MDENSLHFCQLLDIILSHNILIQAVLWFLLVRFGRHHG